MWRLFIPAVLIVVISGCGSGTVNMRGKVTYQGRPVLSGCVTVLNADGTASSGVIQPDGTYSVEGVKRGRVKVGVVCPDPQHARSILNPKAGQIQGKNTHAQTKPGTGGWYPLPRDLGDPEKSGLECDVSSSRVTFDIETK
jgi:hypothetical protein